jgi:hypothetical protein
MDFAIAAGSLFSYSKLADGAKAVRSCCAPVCLSVCLSVSVSLSFASQGEFKLSSSTKKDKSEAVSTPGTASSGKK